jgi:hypothetical protein
MARRSAAAGLFFASRTPHTWAGNAVALRSTQRFTFQSKASKFDAPCSIEIQTHRGTRLVLIGTAHGHRDSRKLVGDAIDHFKPHTTALELDSQTYFGYKRMMELGRATSSEFSAAMQHPHVGRLALIDDARQEAHTRMERGLPWTELVAADLGLWFHQRFSRQLGFAHPASTQNGIRKGLVETRDEFMTAKLADLLHSSLHQGQCIVAVVGKGHVAGILQRLLTDWDQHKNMTKKERNKALSEWSSKNLICTHSDRMPQRRAVMDNLGLELPNMRELDPCAITSEFFTIARDEISETIPWRTTSSIPWLRILCHPSSGQLLAISLCAALERGDEPRESCRVALRQLIESHGYSSSMSWKFSLRWQLASSFFTRPIVKICGVNDGEQTNWLDQRVDDEVRRRKAALADLAEKATRAKVTVMNRQGSSAIALSDHSVLTAPEFDLEPMVSIIM